MNKKRAYLIILIFFLLLYFTNVFTKYVLVKHDVKMNFQEISQICEENLNIKCDYSIKLENLTYDDFEKIKNISIDVDVLNNYLALNIFKIICLAIMFAFLVYIFINYKNDKKEDIKPDFLMLLLFALGAAYKFIHLYLNNISQISFAIFFAILLLALFLFFICYFFFRAVLKNNSGAICLSFFVVNILLASRSFLFFELKLNFSHFLFDGFLYFGLIILFFALILLINTKKLTKFLKFYIIAILVLAVLNCTFQSVKNMIKTHNINQKVQKEITQKIDFNKNIYIILLDMYCGDDSLKYFGYDNSKFYEQLEKENFKVYKNFESNYNRTILTLSSFFNFDYVENLPHNNPTDAIKYCEFFNIAKTLDYKIFYRNPHTSAILLKEGDVDYLTNDDAFNFFNSCYFFVENSILNPLLHFLPLKKEKAVDFYSEIFKYKGKKLVFAHYMMPHFPYLYDEEGKMQKEMFDINETELKGVLNEKSYVSYLKYANRQAQKMIAQIKENDPNSIIILMGDHGPRLKCFYDGENNHLDEMNENKMNFYIPFNTFIAYYNPDLKSDYYKNVKSLINFSRMFANENFNYNFKLLEDKKFFIYTNQKDGRIKNVKGMYL